MIKQQRAQSSQRKESIKSILSMFSVVNEILAFTQSQSQEMKRGESFISKKLLDRNHKIHFKQIIMV